MVGQRALVGGRPSRFLSASSHTNHDDDDGDDDYHDDGDDHDH